MTEGRPFNFIKLVESNVTSAPGTSYIDEIIIGGPVPAVPNDVDAMLNSYMPPTEIPEAPPIEETTNVCPDSEVIEVIQVVEVIKEVEVPIVPDIMAYGRVAKVQVDQNFKKWKGKLSVTMNYFLNEAIINLLDSGDAEIKVQLIQDGKIIQISGMKGIKEVGKSKNMLNYL